LKLRILIVDDEIKSVEPLQAELKKLPETDVFIVGFDTVDKAIEDHEPHIVVLDLAKGTPADQDAPGLGTYEHIWQKKFCPLVFYTAVPELLGEEDLRLKHPFVKTEKKGSGSEERVINHIRGFERHVSALDETSKEIRRALNRALKEVAPRVFKNVIGEAEISDALIRSARRRLAAGMDEELSSGGPNLRSWEHYLCPPIITRHLLTGDILRERSGQRDDPSHYAVVLTPSCDLVSGNGRKPKVEKVLVAKCATVVRLLEDLNLDVKTKKERCRERLLPMLRQGYGNSCLPLPELPGEFPTMAVDFRRLELIELGAIGDGRKEYVRVASVDNPFRELVAWAYILNAARLGLPDRDFDSWVEEIIAALPDTAKKGE